MAKLISVSRLNEFKENAVRVASGQTSGTKLAYHDIGGNIWLAEADECLSGSMYTDAVGNEWGVVGSASVSNGVMESSAQGDYVQLTDEITLGGADFTLEGWWKITTCTSFGRFITFYVTNNASKETKIAEYNGRGCFYYKLNGGNTTNLTSVSIPQNEWFHLALSYSWENKRVRFFLNGELKHTKTSATVESRTYKGCRLMKSEVNGDGNLCGYCDEVRVSDCERYTANFTPDRSVKHELDINTLILCHFDA